MTGRQLPGLPARLRPSERALESFERYTAWPMLVLSILMIPLLVVPLVAKLPRSTEGILVSIDWLIWGTFAAEYGIRLYLAPKKARFIRANLLDLIVVVLPVLRPLRVLRSARALRLLRAMRLTGFVVRGLRALRDVLGHRRLHYVLLVALAVTASGGVLISAFERASPDANIRSVADGLWWAIATVTTIGYGDRYPVTPAGRGLAVVLMLVGVGIFGYLAAALASFFLERGQGGASDEMSEVIQRLTRIEDALARSGSGDPADGPHAEPKSGQGEG